MHACFGLVTLTPQEHGTLQGSSNVQLRYKARVNSWDLPTIQVRLIAGRPAHASIDPEIDSDLQWQVCVIYFEGGVLRNKTEMQQ